jgi:hypothetical protein
MAEPVHMPDYNDDGLPERFKAILYALADYHKHLLQKLTLNTQDPVQVSHVQEILRNQAGVILQALRTGNTLGIQDEALINCINTLRQNNSPYNPTVETLMSYWCEMMFEEYPFSISHNHIEKLYENSIKMVR